MDFELTREQEDLRQRARALADELLFGRLELIELSIGACPQGVPLPLRRRAGDSEWCPCAIKDRADTLPVTGAIGNASFGDGKIRGSEFRSECVRESGRGAQVPPGFPGPSRRLRLVDKFLHNLEVSVTADNVGIIVSGALNRVELLGFGSGGKNALTLIERHDLITIAVKDQDRRFDLFDFFEIVVLRLQERANR